MYPHGKSSWNLLKRNFDFYSFMKVEDILPDDIKYTTLYKEILIFMFLIENLHGIY